MLCPGREEIKMTKTTQQKTEVGYVPVPGSERVALAGAQALGPANPNATLEVLVKLRGKKELPDISDRPEKTLTREALASEYGNSKEDIGTVVKALEKF
jgi:kumamolisin